MWQARSLIAVFVICAVIGAGANDLEGFGDEFDDLPIHADPAPGTDQEQPLQHATTVDSGVSRISGLEWDEDEFEGFQDSSTASFQGDGQQQKAEQPSAPRRPRGPMFVRQEHYYYEIAALVFLVFYGLNVWYGKSVNEKLALAWARTFCSPGGVFDKNFSLLGPGDSDHNELLMKESQSTYKFYASGRRYCQGLLATLDLRARQDAVSLLWYLVDGRKDLLDIEVYMNDHMPPLVMAVATTKLARQFQRDREDVKTFTRQIEPGKDRMPHWPREKLVVLAESSSTFYDIVNHQALEAVFGQEGFTEIGKYFRYMLISSENTDSSYRKVLRFSFVLPDASRMEAVSKLLVAVTHVIDIVGNYQLNPDAKKRAERLRAEQEKKSFAESRRAREEELQKKKAEKLLAEQDRAARMGPEAQRKWEEKEAKKAAKKAVRVKMIRS